MKYDKDIVVKWFAEHGIYAIPELKFHNDRKWRFDFALALLVPTGELAQHRQIWETRLALEVQGGLFSGGRHSRGAALLKEHEKLNAAAALGWRVLYCIPQNLCMQETVDVIKEALRV